VKKAKKIQTPKEQAAAFRKAARELGADVGDEQFQDALRKIAKAKPRKEAPNNSDAED
jgi:hypothetical protein